MLTIRCGEAILRLATEADDDLLVGLMPDDFDHDPTFPVKPGRTAAEHREAWVRSWLDGFRHPETTKDRYLVFVVECHGTPVGLQTLEGGGFERSQEMETTSFLTPSARGRGLGVAMRTAVLALAFDVLEARRCVTASRPDNVASRRVTERVGYEFVERREPVVAGSVRPIDCFVMTRERWAGRDHLPVEIEGQVPWIEATSRPAAPASASPRPAPQARGTCSPREAQGDHSPRNAASRVATSGLTMSRSAAWTRATAASSPEFRASR